MTYSLDLRERVVAAVEAEKKSNREIAALYGVSESSIEK
jgi:transposase